MSDHAIRAAALLLVKHGVHDYVEFDYLDAAQVAEILGPAIDAATAALRQRLADVTLLANMANDRAAFWDEGEIAIDGVDYHCQFDTDGVPILDDTTRAALRAAKGE